MKKLILLSLIVLLIATAAVNVGWRVTLTLQHRDMLLYYVNCEPYFVHWVGQFQEQADIRLYHWPEINEPLMFLLLPLNSVVEETEFWPRIEYVSDGTGVKTVVLSSEDVSKTLTKCDAPVTYRWYFPMVMR